jgi:hypothetical protein
MLQKRRKRKKEKSNFGLNYVEPPHTCHLKRKRMLRQIYDVLKNK